MRKIYSFITLGIIISVYYIFYYSTYPNDSWIHEINLGPHFILIPMLLLILASTGKKGFTISLIVGIIFSIIVSQNRIYIDDKGVHKRNMKTFQTSTIGWKEL